MSPHAVNNFVSDLVLMAQAMEKLPQVEQSLRIANEFLEMERETVKARDADIAQAKAYASTLEQRLHDAEVAKDAAETMFLEADERTSRALDFVKTVFGSAGSLIQALEPPRTTEPVVEQTVQNEGHGAPIAGNGNGDPQPEPIISEVKPIENPLSLSQEHSNVSASVDNGITTAQGQSEPDPTIAPTPTSNISDTPVSDASTVESGLTNSGPYAGKRYFDIPTYVPLDAWLDGGGTKANYHWRPSRDDRYSTY